MILVAEFIMAVAALGFLYRVSVGPTLVDRLLGLDGMLLSIIGILAVESVRMDTVRFLDAMVVVAVVAFIGVTMAARFIERRGA